ncbi:hypothetical protein GJ496_008462 [Pomphorhynchus laevis]|nr:hypothetical protein GJ496_008462 [Pomphorhynchus laevis]
MSQPSIFRKFNEKDNIINVCQMKQSDLKKIKNKIVADYPYIAPYWDEYVLPKREIPKVVKCTDHIELLANSAGNLLFFKQRDSIYIPTLRFLHQFPFMLQSQQADAGAIRFLISGANVMCPGLTSQGGCLTDASSGHYVQITAEGKEHALAIGVMRMSSDEIKSVNKGIAIEVLHYLNDGLWTLKNVK